MDTLNKSHSLFVDYYELTMAQGYFNSGKIDELATFEFFFRENPFNGGFSVICGVEDAIKFIQNFSMTPSDLDYLESKKKFSQEFLEYLAKLRFDGVIRGLPDGTIAFPYEPIIQLTGKLGILQLLETAILNIINFQSLIATKAARICYASRREDTVIEFGLRRAQGEGGILGAKASVIGGCFATSNVLAGKLFDLSVTGTHAHSWIQSFPTELDAFRAYARSFPDNTTLLVDTYDVLRSGVPNAIRVATDLAENGFSLKGIRIDSGDLGWLAIKSAKMLDQAGFTDVKIVLSSDLDEYIIESIIHQIQINYNTMEDQKKAQQLIDRLIWGVGTNLITGSGGKQAAFGGIYKLVELENKPVIKISENRAKTTNPAKKNLWRITDLNGKWVADVMSLFHEQPPKKGDTIYHQSDPSKFMTLKECEAIQLHIDLVKMYNSFPTENSWREARIRRSNQMKQIDGSHVRFLNPHFYKISMTEPLFQMKNDLVKEQLSKFDQS
ncbi:MAG: nicotinate phosphoribosyltransferase [Candidatus Kariarchaeaceae archaeon]